VFCVLEDEVDTLLLEHHLPEQRNVFVLDFAVDLQGKVSKRGQIAPGKGERKQRKTNHDLPTSTLRDPGVGNHLPLLVRLELLDRDQFALLLVVPAQLDPLPGCGR
jgi:hypothetical protein